MELPSCRGCPVFSACNEKTGCIHPDARPAVAYDDFAAAVAAVEAAEQTLMELVCRLQAATNNHAAFSEGSEWKVRAGRRMKMYSIEVRKARKAYAQAVLNAYGSGMTRNGQILWS